MAFLKKKQVYLIFLIIFLLLAAGGIFVHKKGLPGLLILLGRS